MKMKICKNPLVMVMSAGLVPVILKKKEKIFNMYLHI